MQHNAYSNEMQVWEYQAPSTNASGCFFTNVTFTAVAEIGIRGDFCQKLS